MIAELDRKKASSSKEQSRREYLRKWQKAEIQRVKILYKHSDIDEKKEEKNQPLP
jgi:hypothetical protein